MRYDDYSITPLQESFSYYAKNGQKSQCFTIYHEYKQRQTKYSFFYFSNKASNFRVFIGVLSISVLRIAGERFIRWVRVISSLSNLCLNYNHRISIFRACFELPPILRGKKNFEQFVYRLIS